MYYAKNDDLWLYQLDKKYPSVEVMMAEELAAYTLESYAKEYGLDLTKKIVVLHSAHLGWNWEPSYIIVNENTVKEQFTELTVHEHEMFRELKANYNVDEVEMLLTNLLSIKNSQTEKECS